MDKKTYLHNVAVVAALLLGIIILIVLASALAGEQPSKINNQNPTGCAYGDSIPVDSEKCSAETFRDKSAPVITTLPEVGGSGR